MILLKKEKDLAELLELYRKKGQQIGFAPTMGALHQGHISLIEMSEKENDITVSSIFINPTQFNDPNDFANYPVTLEKDIYLLESSGCDVFFLPPVAEIYPGGTEKPEHYNLGYLETVLEGKYRPGHFQGVCQVVHRLLSVIRPDKFYLGQKDYQQCMVIKKLIELSGWSSQIELRICPTLREPDGLAMSSRNLRLNEDDRKKAVLLSKALHLIQQNLKPGNLVSLKEKAGSILIQAGFKVDYIEIADTQSLNPVNDWDGKQKLVALAAAFIGGVRLIDNMILS